jgi:hypothetical protein
MDIKKQAEICRLVKENVEAVLSQYLTKDLVRKISIEIRSGFEWDLGNMEDEKE